MYTYEKFDVAICEDCLLYLEGDGPSVSPEGRYLPDAIADRWPDEIGPGGSARTWIFGPGDCESSFSWTPCDTCGSALGGNRHPATASFVDA